MKKKEFERLMYEVVERDKPPKECLNRAEQLIATQNTSGEVIAKKRRFNSCQIAAMMMSLCIVMVMAIAMPIYLSGDKSGAGGDFIAMVYSKSDLTISESNGMFGSTYLYYDHEYNTMESGGSFLEPESKKTVYFDCDYIMFTIDNVKEENLFFEFSKMVVVLNGYSLKDKYSKYDSLNNTTTYNDIDVRYQVSNVAEVDPTYASQLSPGEWKTVMFTFDYNGDTYYGKVSSSQSERQDINNILHQLFINQ